MPTAAVQRYWDWLRLEYPECVCGAPWDEPHHIIHLNRQRITKDDMLVVGLCRSCHTGSNQSVHRLGGERQFLQTTGWDLVQIATLRRHNYEIRRAA